MGNFELQIMVGNKRKDKLRKSYINVTVILKFLAALNIQKIQGYICYV